MPRSEADWRKERNYQALRRRHSDPVEDAHRTAVVHQESDWKGVCQYCKEKLTGTVAALQAHRCKQFEESCGQAQ